MAAVVVGGSGERGSGGRGTGERGKGVRPSTQTQLLLPQLSPLPPLPQTIVAAGLWST
jgi:hypothetical protein